MNDVDIGELQIMSASEIERSGLEPADLAEAGSAVTVCDGCDRYVGIAKATVAMGMVGLEVYCEDCIKERR